jgi:hypothetical protein
MGIREKILMRLNVYSQDLTDNVVQICNNDATSDEIYSAARLYLNSAPQLHEDDQSAITFWLPKSKHRREEIAIAFEKMAKIFREADTQWC